MSRHRSLAELQQELPAILAAPKDEGVLRSIVVRPAKGERLAPDAADVSLARGVHGDHWAKSCWKTTTAGDPDPDVQICMMNARCIELIAGPIANWPPAGDNLFIDMDLTPANMPPGQRFAIGTAVFEVTPIPHNGCDQFIARFGRDAVLFVNIGEGKKLRLRGIYARVIEDGRIAAGDKVRKIG
jgi:MOSC domain-containing protein YiiM